MSFESNLPRVPSRLVQHPRHSSFEIGFQWGTDAAVNAPSSMFDDIRSLSQSRPEQDSALKNRNLRKILSLHLKQAANSLGNKVPTNLFQVSVVRAVLLAKILFLHIVSLDFAFPGSSLSTIVMSLKTSSEIDFSLSGSPVMWKPALLCWVLVTGAVASPVGDHQRWFVQRIAQFVNEFKSTVSRS